MLSFKNIVFFCAATAISLSAFGEKLKYTENEEVFSNPGQGWAHYGYKLPDAPAVNFGPDTFASNGPRWNRRRENITGN